MNLSELRDEVVCLVDSDVETLRDLPPLQRVGPVYDDLCANFRILAGCALLVEGDVDEYCACLTRSGHARVHLLRRRAEQPELRNPYLAGANSAALFDVLAARNFSLAQEIAALSPREWWTGEEYEEDFCFTFFFQESVEAKPDLRRVEQVLDRLEQLDGSEGKTKLCRAILGGNQVDFNDAFEQLLAEREAELQEDRERFWPDGKLAYRIKSRLYTEALAILNVADRRGLKTASSYPYCPLLARVSPTRPYPASPFV